MAMLRDFRDDVFVHLYNNFYEGSGLREMIFHFRGNPIELSMFRRMIPEIIEKKFYYPKPLIRVVYVKETFHMYIKINGKYHSLYTQRDLSDLFTKFKGCLPIDELLYEQYSNGNMETIDGIRVMKLSE